MMTTHNPNPNQANLQTRIDSIEGHGKEVVPAISLLSILKNRVLLSEVF